MSTFTGKKINSRC